MRKRDHLTVVWRGIAGLVILLLLFGAFAPAAMAKVGTISGMKFNDLNGNGVKDTAEPGLEDWTINLAGPVSGTATTVADGSYSFTNLEPGDYTVSEVLKPGWAQTCPAPPGTYSVTLTGTSATGKDFGNRGNLDPEIYVNKTAHPAEGPVGADITFTINVTNRGNCTLNPVKVKDELQQGLSYVSSDPPADDTLNGILIWNNIGPLAPDESTTITVVAHIDTEVAGVLNNIVTATGTDPLGELVTDTDTVQVAVISVGLEKSVVSYNIVDIGGLLTYIYAK